MRPRSSLAPVRAAREECGQVAASHERSPRASAPCTGARGPGSCSRARCRRRQTAAGRPAPSHRTGRAHSRVSGTVASRVIAYTYVPTHGEARGSPHEGERQGRGRTGCAALASSTAATASALRPSLMGFAASISPSSSTRRKATPGDPALTASAAMSPWPTP